MAQEWKETIETELQAHETNGTWTIETRPKAKIDLTAKWVLAMKSDGSKDD